MQAAPTEQNQSDLNIDFMYQNNVLGRKRANSSIQRKGKKKKNMNILPSDLLL